MPTLILATRARVIGVEALDVEILSAPVPLQKLEDYWVFIYAWISKWFYPRNGQRVAVDMLVAAKAGTQVTHSSLAKPVSRDLTCSSMGRNA